MGNKLIQESTLTNIADALRAVYGNTDKIDPANYSSLISCLSFNKDAVLNIVNTCVNNGNMDSMSWSDINALSFLLVNGVVEATDVNGLLGLSKSFTYNSKTCYAFIIGILQDYLGSTPRGFTFWCVGSNTPFSTSSKTLPITNSAFGRTKDSVGGWGGTSRNDVLRTALQPSGSIYNAMPSDMKSVMKPKTTYYGPTYDSSSTTVSSITDIMFILSDKELYNINNSSIWSSKRNTPFWQYEGTGAAHNKQYQLFANEGITSSSYSKLPSSNHLWLRTCSYYSGGYFMLVRTDGHPLTHDGATYNYGVTPCFCV